MTTLFLACSQPAEEKKSPEPEAKQVEEVKPETTTAVSGEEIYKKTCVACHQADGKGLPNTFPPLAKSDFLANPDAVIEQVIKGKTGEIVVNGLKFNSTMPPQTLNDAEIAEVLNYVYSNWENNGTTFTAEQVKTIREKIK